MNPLADNKVEGEWPKCLKIFVINLEESRPFISCITSGWTNEVKDAHAVMYVWCYWNIC